MQTFALKNFQLAHYLSAEHHGWLVFEDAESVQQEVGFDGVFSAKGADRLAGFSGHVESREADAWIIHGSGEMSDDVATSP